MIEIAVRVAGDHWLNPEEVEAQLALVPAGCSITIDMNTEGASMQALGIDRMIDRYLEPEQVTIRAWANAVETVPYRRAESHLYSHFFWMAQRYWHATILPATHEHRFACLIGRATWPRLRMLADLSRTVGDRGLYSLMGLSHIPPERGINLDPRDRWVDPAWDPRQSLGHMTSIDDHTIRDQYDPMHNTNLSLLAHYHRFDIEIVAESYCHGPCYLATEKTVRPLLARKAMMIYGPRHFLRHLRDQGFETWSDWWDESYDDLEGPARWQAMLAQIQIIATRADFPSIYQDYQPVVDHNHERAREIGSRHQPT